MSTAEKEKYFIEWICQFAEAARAVVEAKRSLCRELVLDMELQIAGQVGRAESVEATDLTVKGHRVSIY